MSCSPVTAVISRYGDVDRFMGVFTCGRERDYCAHAERCVLGTAPTLGQVGAAYGANAPAAWLIPFLWDVSEFCGCREKLTRRQMEELAYLIAREWHWLKVTELMLFFWRMKSGCYGRFYGNIDPMVMTTALRAFVKDRNDIIARHDAETLEEKFSEWKRRAVSYEEHLRRQSP